MSICLADARAAASRRNGAQSRGPKTPEGKARSAQNALKHGLRAQKFVVLGDERAQDFAALEAALADELAPDGALQGLLAGRIARAAWRLERAERIEAELFARHADRDRDLGLALIRDGNGTRAFDTLLRYRGSALAELWRALRLLKALQAEVGTAAEKPIEPESRANPDETAAVPAAHEPGAPCRRADAEPGGTGYGECPAPAPRETAAKPMEPEARGNAGDTLSLSVAEEAPARGERREDQRREAFSPPSLPDGPAFTAPASWSPPEGGGDDGAAFRS